MLKFFLRLSLFFSIGIGVLGLYAYRQIWGPTITTAQDLSFYLPSNSSYDSVYSQLVAQNLLKNPAAFDLLAGIMNYKKDKVRGGHYLLKSGMSTRELLVTLRAGNQKPIKITFNNQRTIEHLAGAISSQIEADSISILKSMYAESNLSPREITKEKAIAMYLPNTYEVYWNISPQDFVDRMYSEFDDWWSKNNRLKKAGALGLSPIECNTLASIVQKESNNPKEQPLLARVYLNRLESSMPLQADPTVVFAIGDYTIKRVLNKDLEFESPYNTYLNRGLPPGPIHQADPIIIDRILDSPRHNYLYFCSKPGYQEEHLFAENLTDHNKNARKYHRWLSKDRKRSCGDNRFLGTKRGNLWQN